MQYGCINLSCHLLIIRDTFRKKRLFISFQDMNIHDGLYLYDTMQ